MNALETSRAGFIYLALGDLDKFFEYVFRAADEHALQETMFRYSPMFEKVRKDLRVAEVFSRAGLTWNWASTNGWRNRGSNPYGASSIGTFESAKKASQIIKHARFVSFPGTGHFELQDTLN